MLTDMNTPLGRAAGNWLEVKESVACLEIGKADLPVSQAAQQRGPTDLRQLVVNSAAHLLVQTRKSKSLAAARTLAEDCLNSGAPRQKWDEMLVAQGADLEAFNRKLALDSTAAVTAEVKAGRSGFISKCDARLIGEVIRDLGGGRLTKESAINFDVGVDRMAKPGERVEKNFVLARIHAADQASAKAAQDRLRAAFEISPRPKKPAPLILEILS